MVTTLSVAMCTYNGERYVEEQLASIRSQTRLPDELVVCDDASADSTAEILECCRATAPFDMRVERNPRRLGITANFEKAIRFCRGEVVALCDQDDVWLPGKLSAQLEALENCAAAGYVFSDAVVVDEALSPAGYTIWQAIRFDRREQRCFMAGKQLEVLLRRNVVTGATLAFRSELRKMILPLPTAWIHDAWIAFAASALGTKGIALSAPTVKYRRHDSQAIGVGPRCGALQRIRALPRGRSELHEELLRQAEGLEESLAHLLARGLQQPRNGELLRAKASHLRARAAVVGRRGSRALTTVVREALSGRYGRFSSGLGSAAADLFRAIGVRP